MNKFIPDVVFKRLVLMVLSVGLMSTANAELQSRLNGQAVYDTDLDITWLADANVAGSVNLAEAEAWVANLSVGGITGWRLPTFPLTSSGGICIGSCNTSELGHLFYNELGGTSGQNILNSSDPDLALFTNIQSRYYWSTAAGAVQPVVFRFSAGNQAGTFRVSRSYNVWAVHPGDVGANTDCVVNCLRVNSIELTNAITEVRAIVKLADEDNSAAGARGSVVQVLWTRPDGSTLSRNANIGTRLRAEFRIPVQGDGVYQLTVVDARKPGYTFDPENSNLISQTISVVNQVDTARIGDTVWLDSDGDGVQDLDESGADSVLVTLSTCDGNFQASTITDNQGVYSFDSLAAGSYQLKVDLPGGFQFSPQNVGTDTTVDSDVNPATGFTPCYYIANGEELLDLDAGLVPDGQVIDTLVIKRAVYRNRRNKLSIKATSDAQPEGSAVITVTMVVNGVNTELGTLKWSAKKGYYKKTFRNISVAPDSVNLNSDQGGVVSGSVDIR